MIEPTIRTLMRKEISGVIIYRAVCFSISARLIVPSVCCVSSGLALSSIGWFKGKYLISSYEYL
jgi:hypothetical protein